MTILYVLLVGLVLVDAAAAAPNVANTNQKGSLLVFPDVRVDDGWNTLVRIQNDGNADVYVLCAWLDGNKNRVDFALHMTRGRAIWFDAATGKGSHIVNRFPTGPANGIDNPFLAGGRGAYGAGMLVCSAVEVDFDVFLPVKWNHLVGTATVYRATSGAYEYPAYAFVIPTGLDLKLHLPYPYRLDGMRYDACPESLIGQFSPANGAVPDVPMVTGTRLVVVGCTIDASQDWRPAWTTLTFDVWNEDEVKFAGAYECAESWHETSFGPGAVAVGGLAGGISAFEDGLDAGSEKFTLATLGTYGARYRVQGVQSGQCENATIQTQATGLLAVQSTFLEGSVGASVLTSVGKISGVVRWP